MTDDVQLKRRRKSILYGIARVLAYIAFSTLCPVRVYHPERFNRPAPFLLIANHNSWLDPIAMAYKIHHQQAAFVGKRELVRNPVARVVLNAMGIIAVERHATDMEAMRACVRALKEGRILGIFPEGTRHHTGLMEQLEAGTALLALRCRVPLIPVYFDAKIRCFHRVHMYVGEPIPLDDLLAQAVDKNTCEQLLARITETYARLSEQCRQEVTEGKTKT